MKSFIDLRRAIKGNLPFNNSIKVALLGDTATQLLNADIVVVNYFQIEGSIMKSTNPRKCPSLISVCDSLFEFRNKYTEDLTRARNIFDKKIGFIFSQALAHYSKESGVKIRELKVKPYYPLSKNKEMSLKERMKISIINLSITLYLLMSKFFK